MLTTELSGHTRARGSVSTASISRPRPAVTLSSAPSSRGGSCPPRRLLPPNQGSCREPLHAEKWKARPQTERRSQAPSEGKESAPGHSRCSTPAVLLWDEFPHPALPPAIGGGARPSLPGPCFPRPALRTAQRQALWEHCACWGLAPSCRALKAPLLHPGSPRSHPPPHALSIPRGDPSPGSPARATPASQGRRRRLAEARESARPPGPASSGDRSRTQATGSLSQDHTHFSGLVDPCLNLPLTAHRTLQCGIAPIIAVRF